MWPGMAWLACCGCVFACLRACVVITRRHGGEKKGTDVLELCLDSQRFFIWRVPSAPWAPSSIAD